MRSSSPRRRRALLLAVFWTAGLTLSGAPSPSEQDETPLLQTERERGDDRYQRLPNGRSQRDEILKAEYRQNVKDAGQLVELAEQLRQEIEKNESYVLSLSALKKTDDIEKLVKKIRARLRHD
jgi:hypothetical protein